MYRSSLRPHIDEQRIELRPFRFNLRTLFENVTLFIVYFLDGMRRGCYNKCVKSRAVRFSGARSDGARALHTARGLRPLLEAIFYDVRRLLGAGANYEQYP